MKRENTIFKLGLAVLLIALVGLMLSCEKSERDFTWPYKYQGTCKILKYNETGHWGGIAVFVASDTLDLNGVDSAVTYCSEVGGTFILNNDSNGVMCYPCKSNNWRPK